MVMNKIHTYIYTMFLYIYMYYIYILVFSVYICMSSSDLVIQDVSVGPRCVGNGE